MFIITANFT